MAGTDTFLTPFRITPRKGGLHPQTTAEMTGTNCTLDAAHNGPEKQRQLLRKKGWLTESYFRS